MSSRVIILDKSDDWKKEEIVSITLAGAEVEKNVKFPRRIVLTSRPVRCTISEAIKHCNYTSREVEYHERWL